MVGEGTGIGTTIDPTERLFSTVVRFPSVHKVCSATLQIADSEIEDRS